MEFLLWGALSLNVYATVLVIARALVYRTKLYRPMLWNILLSVLPAVILGVGFIGWSLIALTLPLWVQLLWLVPVAMVWILMLPNASYLITELNLSHRVNEDAVPMWFDVILVITLAMSGVANTVINVFIVHFAYAIGRYGDTAEGLISADALWLAAAVMTIVSFGMYLGRHLRLNSWDLTHPSSVFTKIVAHFSAPAHVWAGIGFTFTYALFLAIMYFMMVAPLMGSLLSLESMRGS